MQDSSYNVLSHGSIVEVLNSAKAMYLQKDLHTVLSFQLQSRLASSDKESMALTTRDIYTIMWYKPPANKKEYNILYMFLSLCALMIGFHFFP